MAYPAQTTNFPKTRRMLKWGAPVLVAAGMLLTQVAPVSAQMFEKPWSAKSRDRSSLAVYMKQAESGLFDKSTGTGTGTGGSLTQLVCGGGGGTSSATANSACIIMNNSNGVVDTGQDSTGDQTANTTDNSTNSTSGSLSDALATASGANN
ncbi:hypothetical protein [Thalassospira lucentensis]|uniref:hypothetical protein n=1 Tax=Thalassospira lucentensis TaxID=168935 RepID=UPI00142E5294|nr:hypothetical protein [Thalassospira lucentensis]NIZ03869.1 hypothetical protein [Thalassospira lucentensis]